MPKSADLLNAVIENSDKVRAYDVRALNRAANDIAGGTRVQRKLSGSMMMRRKKQQSGESKVSYTFAL